MAYTQEQIDVITHDKGHAVVSAVAGSGKTSVMVARTVFLLKKGVRADEIAVLMFNKKAKIEFQSRLKAMCSEFGLVVPEVKTFHSFGLMITNELVKLNFLPNKRLVFNDWEITNTAKTILRTAVKYSKNKIPVTSEVVEDFVTFIDQVKSDLKKPSDKFSELGFREDHRIFVDAFLSFEKERQKKSFKTFADLVYDPVKVIKKNPELAQALAGRFKHIIVDEYQDINEIQQELIRLLTGAKTEVMVVGDADQCIYEWRGAKPEYITSLFEEDFKGAKRYALTKTFRNGHAISLAANYVISNNMDRHPQVCISNEGNPDTQIYTHATKGFNDTASDIVKKWDGPLNQICVLLRLYNMAAPIEISFLKNNIPYHLEGADGRSILEQPIMNSVVALLRFSRGDIYNLDLESATAAYMSILDIIPTRMNKTILRVLAEHMSVATKHSESLSILREAAASSGGFVKNALEARYTMLKFIAGDNGRMQAHEIIDYATRVLNINHYYESIHVKSQNSHERIMLLQQIRDIAESVETGGESFVEFIDGCKRKMLGNKKSEDSVLITTIHKAKGMEWPLVIIPDLKEGEFPYYEEPSPVDEVESERRLFYVALTRAEKEVHLLHPIDTNLSKEDLAHSTNVAGIEKGGASRFLIESNVSLSKKISESLYKGEKREIDAFNGVMAQKYLKLIGNTNILVNSDLVEGDKRLYTKPRGFVTGDRVYHSIFGEGDVKGVVNGEKATISIKFDREKDPINFILKNIDIRKVS